MKFNKLEITEKLLLGLEKLEYYEMTDIQEKAIPEILKGKDVVGQAQTGTGKTLAFLLPIIQNAKKGKIECLILAPTRELVVQIKDEAKKFQKYSDFKVGEIIGGESYSKQFELIRSKPNIICGTPGRIIDHLEKGKLKLDDLKYFVIDEADEMLKVGFKDEIDKIIEFLPKKRQSLLFSATMNPNVKKIADKIMSSPINIAVSKGLATTKNIEQYAIIVKEREKLKILTRVLDIRRGESAIVFGRTKKRADELSLALNELGYPTRALHGDLIQRQRLQILREFKAGSFDVLIATDVAARGIDVNNIKYIFNFDLPQEVEYYVHRIGRCGRAGKPGTSISFLRDVEMPHLEKIRKETHSKIEIIPQPTKEDVELANINIAVDKILDKYEAGGNENFFKSAKQLLQKYDDVKLLAAALSNHSSSKKGQLPTLTGEPPVRIKSKGNHYGDRKGHNSKNNRRTRIRRRR